MAGSQGRRKAAYVAARTYFKQAGLLCWMCNQRPGTTVDHDPPLYRYMGNEEAWAANGGRYRPACPTCQARQGAQITNTRRRPQPSRQW